MPRSLAFSFGPICKYVCMTAMVTHSWHSIIKKISSIQVIKCFGVKNICSAPTSGTSLFSTILLTLHYINYYISSILKAQSQLSTKYSHENSIVSLQPNS